MTDLGVAAAHITAVLVARTSMPPAEAVKEYFNVLDALKAEAELRRRAKDAKAIFGFQSTGR